MNIQLRPEQASSLQAGRSRVANYDWTKVSEELSGQGCAVIERLLSPDECRQVAALFNPVDGIAFGRKLPHEIHIAVRPNYLDAPDVALLRRR